MGARRDVRRGCWLAATMSALGAVLLPGVFLLVTQPEGWGQKLSREDVQAAYLFNFGKFVRWPAGADQGPMVVCVEGQEHLGQVLAGLIGSDQIGGRPVQERTVRTPEEVGGCSILYVGSADREDSFLSAAAGKPILTVGDAPDFLARGGAIQFLLVGDHVRFSVNLEACSRHRMSVSSELLKVAVMVTGTSGGAK